MKKQVVRIGAAALASALLFCGHTAAAEERRLGDYIYVPAMQASEEMGRITLRVEGLALTDESDEAAVVPSLAGAEFGVYVVSSDGELTPWANPLYPSEQMRIRSGEEPVSFTLPDSAEFYLMQTSAPQGYLFEEGAVIPVTGSELVVRNYMPGELVVSAVDSLGEPLPGVSVTLAAQDGGEQTLVTDENGRIVLQQGSDTLYTVSETALPEGVFSALGVSVNHGEAVQLDQAQVQLETTKRSYVTFVHPAAGSVQLNMTLTAVDDDGEVVVSALPGVAMEIESDPHVRMVTDGQGMAQASLLEGTYLVRFGYEGEENLILPFAEAQVIVQSGAATVIDLSASDAMGRVVLAAQAESAVRGGSYTLENVYTGEAYGPFAMDAEGVAVSSALPAGEYRISEFAAPQDMQLGELICDGQTVNQTGSLIVSVQPGTATQVSAKLLTRERQQYALFEERIGGDGKTFEEALSGSYRFELIDSQGNAVADLQAADGLVTIEALSGSYTLHMEEELAQSMGLEPVSKPFELPDAQEAIVFSGREGRVILSSVDENGMPVSGASYLVTDASGAQSIVVCNEYGEGVSQPLPAGEVHITTLTVPQQHAAAQETTASLGGGEALRLSMTHESFGAAHIDVRMMGLDEQGRASYAPLSGAAVQLYRVSDDGQRMTETDHKLNTDENGSVEVRLEEGEYVAQVDPVSLKEGSGAGEAVRFAVENAASVPVQLTCQSALGGLRVRVLGADESGELLAQIRFELAGEDGEVYDLMLTDDGYYVGGLSAGVYTLRQTQIPQGYTPAAEREAMVAGAQVTVAEVALEEYAMLSVSKMGLTFNDRLQTFVVPLEGQYGVYTMEDGEMKPYPSEEDQMTVWANASPEQIAQGRVAQLRLPAQTTGTTYYLREIGSAEGFAADETYHEAQVSAGAQVTVSCTVSSDRGFFEFTQLDAATGSHVPGGAYELVNAAGETVLSFAPDSAAYRNEMAVPVGTYTLRQLEAGEGYALSDENVLSVDIEPYLTQGGNVAQVQMTSVRVPESTQMNLIADIYAAREQGLTLVSVDGGALASGYALHMPQMQIEVQESGGARVDVVSVVLSSAQDDQGSPYMARVEYCLAGGGWQPSDARMTGVISGPTAVSLADVEDDVRAVRVTYLNAETGEEIARSGFTPGQAALGVRVGAQDAASVQTDARFGGVFAYRTAANGARQTVECVSEAQLSFETEGDGVFETVSAGRDGRISGVVFFDENADGLMGSAETGRYAGMTVDLLGESGEQIASCRTDSAGRYQFTSIAAGTYTVQFDAGEEIIFSKGGLGSEHAVSGIEDMHYGLSAEVKFDGDHTDYVIHAGCIYAATLSGVVSELDEQGERHGVGGLSVEMHASKPGADEEPSVVMTDDLGQFSFGGILEGEYEVVLRLPQGYLSPEAQDGAIVRTLAFEQGDSASFGEVNLTRAAGIAGRALVDENGDGQIDENAAPLEGAQVVLLSLKDGRSEEIERTVTAADGAYAFENLYPGEYSVLFELEGEWTFTRYGEDSLVYGAVSQSGSTQAFELAPGERADGVDAGVTIPAQLSVMVFEDAHADGEKGTYEYGLEGVSVSLIRLENGEEAEAVTYTTDEQGMALFTGVSPGEYVLGYKMPGLWRSTKQVDPQTTNYPVSCVPQSTQSAGRSLPFTLGMGQSGSTMYIGAMLSGSISGEVFFDDDANAMWGEGEAQCPEVAVELLDTQGEVLMEIVSDESGHYAFDGVAPGRYRVRFTAPQACGFSATERTMARGGVQASTENVSTTRSISVTAGSAVTTANAGVVRLCSITGVIWEDRSADCAQDGVESGLANVTVNLMDGAGRMILAVTTTDENGAFTFKSLTPDTYKLRVDAPEGYVFSGALSGSVLGLESQRNARGYSAPFTLLGGVNAQGVGFGLLTQGTIRGRVWEDIDYDALMEEDEDGLRGVTLTLTDLSGNQAAQTQSLRSGEFEFTGLMPGEYTLSAALPEGYVFTAEGGESAVSGADQSSASAYLGTLYMGEEISDIRIGALRPASVGGVVWMDQDNDGRRQNGQAGVQGVTVTLQMLSGKDQGRTLQTLSDDTGAYRFDGVMPGDAQLTFTLEEGYAFAKNASGRSRVSVVPMTDALVASSETIAVRSGEDHADLDVGVVGVGTLSGAVWTDDDYDGRMESAESGAVGAQVTLVNAKTGEAVRSAVTDENGTYRIDFVRVGEYKLQFALPSGMIFTKEGDSAIIMVDSDTAQTAQFEVAMGESVSGMNVGAIEPASISGQLTLDLDEDSVCGAEEPGMAGADVTLMQGGTVMTTVKTQEDGSFELAMLRPGTYRVRVTLPDDALFSAQTALKLAQPDAQEGETAEMTLAMGQRIALEPVAAVRGAQITGRAWLDQDVDGLMDGEEPALSGVRAELLSGDTVVAAQSVDGSGAYAFKLLRSGDYAVRFVLPQGMLLADQAQGEMTSSAPVVPGNVGTTQSFALAMGETKDNVHIGGILPGEIGDTVWLDRDGNGLQDYQEPLLAGVGLTLTRVLGDGTPVETLTTVSDEYGYYHFRALRPGSYVLRADTKEGNALTVRFGEPLGEIDSDIDPQTGVSGMILLASGQTLRNIDVGFAEYAD